VDYFVSVFTLSLFVLDARLICLAVFGVGASVGVLLKIRDAFRHGVRIQRI